MHSDLSRVCWGCRIRLPGEAERCPRCHRRLGSTETDSEAKKKWRESLAGVRPIRDALLWIPILVSSLGALVAGLALGIQTAIVVWEEGGGGAVAILVLGTFAGAAGVAIVLWTAWLPWAAIVFVVAWLFRDKSSTLQPLKSAPFPVANTRGHGRVGALAKSFQERVGKPTWRKGVAAYLALLGIELVAELASPASVFAAHPLGEALWRSAVFAAVQAFGIGMAAVPFAFCASGALLAADRVRLVLMAWRDRRALEAYSDFERFRPELTEDRGHAIGRAEALDGQRVVAPLSGEPCLGFRLCGTARTYAIDDAGATSLLVVTGEGEVAVRGERFVVVLPEPTSEPVEPSSEQRERLAEFFRKRGLPAPAGELEIGESLLRDGDAVVVHGAESSEPAAGQGYRERGTRRILDDRDDRPVLIEREEPPERGV